MLTSAPVSEFQILTSESSDALTIHRPSYEKATELRGAEWPVMVHSGFTPPGTVKVPTHFFLQMQLPLPLCPIACNCQRFPHQHSRNFVAPSACTPGSWPIS